MNPAACDPADSAQWAAILDDCHQRMRQFQALPGLGNRALGVAAWDGQLWKLGQAWLHSREAGASPKPENHGADVYLATQLYSQGGHTALIGDFIQALPAGSDGAPRVILTNIRGENKLPLADKILSRLGLGADGIELLGGASLREKMELLLERLHALRPRRLFLFHHPEDPLASVAAQPELAGQCILVHHADAVPSFGLHLPGIRLIDLNPVAAAMSRMLGLAPACLHLTSPDPGPRPGGFLERGKLVTASSGSQHKFTKPYVYGYAETVGLVLATTGGWHLHIGPLDAAMLDEIMVVLRRRGLASDRFLHVPWAASVAKCLWEHQSDVYLSSFPTDGARTNVEVFASGTPHLRHAPVPHEHWLDGSMSWDTWENLASLLRGLADARGLQERGEMVRRTYERQHHPEVFARTLQQILTTGQGWIDPHESFRDAHVMRSLLRSLTTALTKQDERLALLEEQIPPAPLPQPEPGWRSRLRHWFGND